MVNTRKVLNKVIGLLAPQKDIEIIVKGNFPKVPVNEIALQQVFQNLITNAIKYNDKPKGVINILADKIKNIIISISLITAQVLKKVISKEYSINNKRLIKQTVMEIKEQESGWHK